MVFVEVLNEPAFIVFQDSGELPNAAARWQSVQGTLLAAMRAGAPNHTLIAKGYAWDGLDSLLVLTPYADSNIVYNIHTYEPFLFTHQGASWVEGMLNIQNIPYPATAEQTRDAIRNQSMPEWLRNYANDDWDRDRLLEFLQPAFDWAETHDVPLTINEFGVYRLYADPAQRNFWHDDMITLLEENNVGWAMWEYDAGFGIVQKWDDGSRHVDLNQAAAMDLNDRWGKVADFAPLEGFASDSPEVTFTWPTHPSAVSYQLILDMAYPPVSIVNNAAPTTFSTTLTPGTYYWQIAVVDAGTNVISNSYIRTLHIRESAANAAPKRTYMNNTRTPTLTWSAVTWATGYQIQIDDNANFSSVAVQSGVLNGVSYTPSTLYPMPNGTWFWRVRARKADGVSWSGWSAAETFTVEVV